MAFDEFLSNISIRGRVACVLLCIEEALVVEGIESEPTERMLDEFWVYVEDKKLNTWEEKFVDNYAVIVRYCEDKNDVLLGVFRGIPEYVLEMLSLAMQTALNNIYQDIINHSECTFHPCSTALHLAAAHGIAIPNLKDIEDLSNISQCSGWGQRRCRSEYHRFAAKNSVMQQFNDNDTTPPYFW